MIAARKNVFSRICKLIRPYRGHLYQSLVLLLFLTGLGLLTPFFIGKIIGVGLKDKQLDVFLTFVALLVASQFISTLLGLLNRHIMRTVGGRVVFDLRRQMYVHLHRLSLSFYESRGSGEIMARLMNDVSAITILITGTALNAIVSIFSATAIIGILFYLSWPVALLALGVMPFHYLTYYMFKRRLSHQTWKSSEKTSQIYGKANEVFDAAKMVKAHSSESREIRTLIGQLREGYEISIHSGLLSSIWSSVSNLISNWGNILVMLVCGAAVIVSQTMELDMYITLMGFVGMLYSPIDQLISVANQLIPAKVGIQRVFEILDLEPEVEDKPGALRQPLRGEVVFDGVEFAYPNGKQVLTDMSFRAEPGQAIAIVGPSGSGKTTIANLIARFYDCTAGAIYLDGVDIHNYALASLRKQMSIVLQETFLFRGTVRENLYYGRPKASQQMIEHAARLANAHEFIQTLPDGYDTIIGSRGARLSGGQRQRLAIARALIREPRILILDEATSSLDSASETKVQEALNTLMKDRTTFIIAHRLSTIQNANKILVLDNGRIVQCGTHGQLITEDGLYRQLYDPDWAKRKEQRDEQELHELAAVS